MKIIFAQGNPGIDFHNTRHNVGFALLDAYANVKKVDFTEKTKFHAYIAEFTEAGEKVLLVKPTTYYNDTGVSARALVDFYKVETTNVLVLHDDLMLPLGTIRTREKGSDAGNNGIKSLNAHLDQNYKRIRVGIWTELAEHMDATAFVLGKFTQDERKAIAELQAIITRCIDDFICGRFESTSYK